MTFRLCNNTSGVAWFALRKKRNFHHVQVSWRDRHQHLHSTSFALGENPLSAVRAAVEAWERGTGTKYPMRPHEILDRLLRAKRRDYFTPRKKPTYLFASGLVNPWKLNTQDRRFSVVAR